ncbi:hypothetical protein XK26_11210, partial [Streptococcus suis]
MTIQLSDLGQVYLVCGKTNILESIYVLALTRSHRTRTDKDLLQFQEKELSISGLLHRTSGKVP